MATAAEPDRTDSGDDALGTTPPTYQDILAAARRLEGLAVRTPLIEPPVLAERTGGRVLVKAEMFQRTGSFKFRGAYNRISQIPAADRPKGVVAFSSGNHAQGVAAAAKLLGMAATIVMPRDAPAIKLNRTRALGAKVIEYDRASEAREAIGEKIAMETGATLVRPYDDRAVMCGQGTVGYEIAEEMEARGIRPDAVLAPCSGGGLIAGTATALAARYPGLEMISVEPAGFDDTARSLAAGKRVSNDALPASICDALMSPTPGELTFAVNSRLLARGLAVDDDDVRAAIAFAFRELKLVIEPGGAVALAALLAGKYDAAGKTVVIIASGGNADPALFAEILASAA
ncbi:MAG TPA: threonine/serine dehydratase [Alphaproteobacteria bacterium]|nr:threonine/serine dehydratase [Alphaproteobacteria bacterium]